MTIQDAVHSHIMSQNSPRFQAQFILEEPLRSKLSKNLLWFQAEELLSRNDRGVGFQLAPSLYKNFAQEKDHQVSLSFLEYKGKIL